VELQEEMEGNALARLSERLNTKTNLKFNSSLIPPGKPPPRCAESQEIQRSREGIDG